MESTRIHSLPGSVTDIPPFFLQGRLISFLIGLCSLLASHKNVKMIGNALKLKPVIQDHSVFLVCAL